MKKEIALMKWIFMFSFLCLGIVLKGQLAIPLPNGHAHNDYEKPWTPLLKALEEGFVSVEIDVFPYGDELKVAHIPFFLGSASNLEDLYFKPLEKWIQEHGQLFQDSSQRVIFMVDIKRDKEKAYVLLKKLCIKYEKLVTCYFPTQDSVRYGYLDLLLSGNKPYAQVMADSNRRLMRIDGSVGDIGDKLRTAKIVPRVSANYGSLFNWNGHGIIPERELAKLRNIVQRAHAENRKVRFWAMPNKESVWKLLLDEGVDWMNVDKLENFRLFYENYKKNKTDSKQN